MFKHSAARLPEDMASSISTAGVLTARPNAARCRVTLTRPTLPFRCLVPPGGRDAVTNSLAAVRANESGDASQARAACADARVEASGAASCSVPAAVCGVRRRHLAGLALRCSGGGCEGSGRSQKQSRGAGNLRGRAALRLGKVGLAAVQGCEPCVRLQSLRSSWVTILRPFEALVGVDRPGLPRGVAAGLGLSLIHI